MLGLVRRFVKTFMESSVAKAADAIYTAIHFSLFRITDFRFA